LKLATAALLTVAATAGAQSDTIPGVTTPIVTTHHTIALHGKTLAYTARAGVLPIRLNETGEPHGYIFFVAYAVDRPAGSSRRPLTFAWNGGPGSNALLVHLDALGPRRLDPDRLTFEDNQATWLDATDLVFVDPVGTGFSRPARPEFADDFYGVLGDNAATVEFIRTYRTRFDAWDAPVYLAGESYGVWRAAGAAESMEKGGQRLAGTILISGGIPVGPIVSDEMKAALFLPTRTAAAFYHKKLAPDLMGSRGAAMNEAEQWARTVYAPALRRLDSLTATERDQIAAQLARFTGLDTQQIDRKTLIVDRQFFIDSLLRDRGQGSLGRFDTRQIGPALRPDRATDAKRRAIINRYLRQELGFGTDLVYQGLETGFSATPNPEGVNARWKYDQGDPNAAVVVKNTDGPPGGTPPWLRRAMEIDPRLRAFVATGTFDSLNSCPGNAYLVSHAPPSISTRITFRCYDGGHMMYEDRDARFRLREDIGRFYQPAP
jgi:carboxypeptidase C (cathepsin A)